MAKKRVGDNGLDLFAPHGVVPGRGGHKPSLLSSRIRSCWHGTVVYIPRPILNLFACRANSRRTTCRDRGGISCASQTGRVEGRCLFSTRRGLRFAYKTAVAEPMIKVQSCIRSLNYTVGRSLVTRWLRRSFRKAKSGKAIAHMQLPSIMYSSIQGISAACSSSNAPRHCQHSTLQAPKKSRRGAL